MGLKYFRDPERFWPLEGGAWDICTRSVKTAMVRDGALAGIWMCYL